MIEYLFRCPRCGATAWFRTLKAAQEGICEHGVQVYRTSASRRRPPVTRTRVARGGKRVEVSTPPQGETR